MIIGLIIWGIAHEVNVDDRRYRIDVDAAQVSRLADGYAHQFGTKPTRKQLASLVDRYVQDEIAFREGSAMGLARDDEIVRRRIVQKYEFLTTDLAQPLPPSDADLAKWFAAHASAYRSPTRTSFVHIFFASDRVGDEAARRRAEQLLPTLGNNATDPVGGDPFPGPAEANNLTPAEMERIFGHSPLAAALPTMATGRWNGPYRSGYGWHVVFVTDHLASATRSLTEIRDQVVSDYLAEKSKRLNDASVARVRQRYDVHYAGPTS